MLEYLLLASEVVWGERALLDTDDYFIELMVSNQTLYHRDIYDPHNFEAWWELDPIAVAQCDGLLLIKTETRTYHYLPDDQSVVPCVLSELKR